MCNTWAEHARPDASQVGAFVMRLTLVLLGHTFDVSLEPTADASEDDPLRDLGTTGHYPVGFVASHEMPDEIPIRHQCSPYEDDSEARR